MYIWETICSNRIFRRDIVSEYALYVYIAPLIYIALCCGRRLLNQCHIGQPGHNNTAFLNTLRPRQNCRHFADDIFKHIFFNENVWISIKISLKFVAKGPINKIPALFQIMDWRRPGDKPLSEAMLVGLPTHICVTRPQWVNAFLNTRDWKSIPVLYVGEQWLHVFNIEQWIMRLSQIPRQQVSLIVKYVAYP